MAIAQQEIQRFLLEREDHVGGRDAYFAQVRCKGAGMALPAEAGRVEKLVEQVYRFDPPNSE